MVREMSKKTIRSWASKLRRLCPTLLPVRVYVRTRVKCRETGKPVCGLTELSEERGYPSRFTILISEGSNQVMFDTLLHEWAHCLSWQETRGVTDHSLEWGLAMSRIYTAMVDAQVVTQ